MSGMLYQVTAEALGRTHFWCLNIWSCNTVLMVFIFLSFSHVVGLTRPCFVLYVNSKCSWTAISLMISQAWFLLKKTCINQGQASCSETQTNIICSCQLPPLNYPSPVQTGEPVTCFCIGWWVNLNTILFFTFTSAVYLSFFVLSCLWLVCLKWSIQRRPWHIPKFWCVLA
jgi:hypothetical protein